MEDPKNITTVAVGATYIVPIYHITDEGLEYFSPRIIAFVKGDKSNDKIHRQAGFMTESLLVTCKQYLIDVQQGHLKDEDTQEAITYLELALNALDRRQEKRKNRGVNQTYNK